VGGRSRAVAQVGARRRGASAHGCFHRSRLQGNGSQLAIRSALLLARSTSVLKATPHTCLRARAGIPRQRCRRGCVCPIPAVRPPAAALLLCCLQDSIAWLPRGRIEVPWRVRGRLARLPR
jgi:hypothetical protein